ncbi:MAG TPA: DedA family protein [Verrucomicrobiae bacterium]|nr:DedA family protein [Verrucomicrobiae bacterium]
MNHLQDFVVGLIDHHGYVGLYIAMAAGNIGAPVGAEVLVPLAGALVATGHLSNLWLVVAVAVAGELTGQTAAYAVGRYGGRPFVERFGKYVRFHSDQLDRVDGFFARYGTFAIFICRFVPVVRGIVGIPAGIARMALVPFYLWTLLGSIVFCGGLAILGHALGNHLSALLPQLHAWSHALLAALIVLVLAIAIVAYIRSRSPKS